MKKNTGLACGVYLQSYNFIAGKLDHWCDVEEMQQFANWTTEQRRFFSTDGSCQFVKRDYSLYSAMTFDEASAAVGKAAVPLVDCEDGPNKWRYQSDDYGLTVQNEVSCTSRLSFIF